MTDFPPSRRDLRDDGRSDAELVDATRAGDSAAYALLWSRHIAAARLTARAVTRSIDPDDLASESFARVLKTIRAGGGPTAAFRPYLYTTIRNVAATWGRQHPSTLGLEAAEGVIDDKNSDPAEQFVERTTLVRAFRALPERWRSLLWYLEVEGMTPREIAPLLGMTPNAVAALSYRARLGLRRAWIDVHIGDSTTPEECKWVCERLTGRTRKRLPLTDRRRLTTHLTSCQWCQIVAADLDDVSGKLRAVILPLSIGLTAAATLASLRDSQHAWAASAPALTRSTGDGIAAGVAAGVLTATAAAAVVATAVWLSFPSVPTANAPDSPTTFPAPARSPSPEEPDVPELTLDPIQESSPANPESPRVPRPPVAPRTPVPPAPAPGDAAPRPDAGPDPALSPTPPTPPPASPMEPVEDEASAAPTLAGLPSNDLVLAPRVEGAGTPGALIILKDEDDTILTTGLVDDAGTFHAQIPSALIHQGMRIAASQTEPQKTPTAASHVLGPLTFRTPSIAGVGVCSGAGGVDDVLSATLLDADDDARVDDVLIHISGVAGAAVVVEVDGVPSGNLHRLSSEPLTRHIPDVDPGPIEIRARYVDSVTGATGLPMTVIVDAQAPPEPDELRIETVLPPRSVHAHPAATRHTFAYSARRGRHAR